jgi:hypothetical protein
MPVEDDYWRRLALFSMALAKKDAGELVAGVAPALRDRVEALMDEAGRLPSSERQARLALEFEAPHDVGIRLRWVLSSAGPRLRQEILHRLPGYHRALVADLDQPLAAAFNAPPLLNALAARLAREATR